MFEQVIGPSGLWQMTQPSVQAGHADRPPPDCSDGADVDDGAEAGASGTMSAEGNC